MANLVDLGRFGRLNLPFLAFSLQALIVRALLLLELPLTLGIAVPVLGDDALQGKTFVGIDRH